MSSLTFRSAIGSFFLLFTLSNCWAETLDQVVAIVNRDIITQSELDKQTDLFINQNKEYHSDLPSRDFLKPKVLDNLILTKLQLQLAEQHGLVIDEVTVDNNIQLIAERKQLSIAELKGKLETLGIPYADFRQQVHNELVIDYLRSRAIRAQLSVSKQEIDGFLKSPIGQDETGTEYRLAHILLMPGENPTNEEIQQVTEKANSIMKKIKDDESFAEMALKHSNAEHALTNGDLGWRKIAAIPTLFVKHIANMKKGDTVGPIRSSSGFHIIRLIDKRNGEQEKTLEFNIRQIVIKETPSMSAERIVHQLNGLRKRIQKGEGFEQLAKQFSEELASAAKGGDMGWLTQAQMSPEYFQNISKLGNGQISKPFKAGPQDWYIVQVLGRQMQDHSDEVARNKAKNYLLMRKYEESLASWLQRMREEAQITVYQEDAA